MRRTARGSRENARVSLKDWQLLRRLASMAPMEPAPLRPSRCIAPVRARMRLRLQDPTTPGLCRVLNAEGQVIALIDPVTRRRLPV